MVRINIHNLYNAAPYAARAVLTALLVSTCTTLRAAEYPIIFTSWAEVQQLGISVGVITQNTRHFPNKCYAYGEGGYFISISNESVARFKSRGFSVQSVCLGLVSETRYDPESGRRLPTYIIADKEQIARDLREHGEAGFGAITAEMPLDLPDCFRNGTPYSDCNFRFGRKTGKRLSAAETDTYAELGAALDKWTRALMAAGRFAAGWQEESKDEFLDRRSGFEMEGFRSIVGYYSEASAGRPALLDNVPFSGIRSSDWERLGRYSSASFWVGPSSFPRGYGYALDADGGADPGVSPETVKTAMDGLSKSQIDVEELRRRLNAR